MEEADLILNVASFKVGWEVETEPGLISTSPARSNRQRVSREDVLWWMQSFWRVNNLGLKMKMKGSRSRDWHTESGGMRGRCGCWREGSRGGCEWQRGQTNPKPMYKNKRANARTLTKWRRGSQVPWSEGLGILQFEIRSGSLKQGRLLTAKEKLEGGVQKGKQRTSSANPAGTSLLN